MNRILLFLSLLLPLSAEAVEVTQNMQTSIGIFDACTQSLVYKFKAGRYELATSLQTTGTFGKLYPFHGQYHAYGTYNRQRFIPEDYGYEVWSRSHHRTKQLTYKDGVPQTRIKVRDGRRLEEPALVEPDRLADSIDLLSTFGIIIEQVLRTGKCDMKRYSFNGKKYSLSDMETIGHETIETPYYSGEALKCRYKIELQKGASAGFMLNKNVPIYLWILQDHQTRAPFVAKVEVQKTPFGKLLAYTTSIEVKE